MPRFPGSRFFGGGRGYVHPAPPPRGYYGPRLVEVAPVLAPAVGQVTISAFSLDGNTLSATINVDGQTYQGSLDLSELAQAVGDRVAAYHAQLHQLAQQAATDPNAVAATAPQAAQIAQTASGEQQAAITVAGVALVGSLVDKHRAKHDLLCAGWFDSITNAVEGAAKGVYHAGEGAYRGITHTWKKLKGPIQMAATAFGGPAAGALAGTVIDAANGDIGAKQAIAQTRAAAAINPTIAKNLTAATTAAAKATAAVHIADTVAQAAQGDPGAGSQVQELVQSAAQGDPGATTALELAQTLAQMGGLDAAATAQAAPAVASGSLTDAAVLDSYRRAAMRAVWDLLGNGAASDGWFLYMVRSGAGASALACATEAELAAAERMAAGAPGLLYSAVLALGASAPQIVRDQCYSTSRPEAAATAVSGIVSDLRHAASHAAQRAHAPNGETVFGYVRPHGNPPQIRAFRSVDDADDWYGQWLNLPDAYLYVAYYDKSDPSWPRPLNEQIGRRPPDADDAVVAGWFWPLATGAAGFAAGMFAPELGRAGKHLWGQLRGEIVKVKAPVAPPPPQV